MSKRADEFREKIWFDSGLRTKVNSFRKRGFSAKFKGVRLLGYVLAGRCMITLTSGNKAVTMVGDPNEALESQYGRFGLQSFLNVSLNEAEVLFDYLIDGFKLDKVKEDTDVSIA